MIGETTIDPLIISRGAPASVVPLAFATVEVYREAAPILPAWDELETRCPCSIYQTSAWILPWMATLGRKANLQPLFILARDASNAPVALLCLGLVRRGPFHIASFLGGKDSNLNLPLVRPGHAWTPKELRQLLREAGKILGADRPDLFVLAKQPFSWHGAVNPFAGLPHRRSPSDAYGTSLPPCSEQLFTTKLSKEGRKKLRKKEAKLAALGPLTHLVAKTKDEQRIILDAFLAQKLARFRDKGITSEFAAPEMRAFIEVAGVPSGHGIELHALFVGERIVATYGGAAHDGHWSGMFNSFDAEEEIAKSSPGELLLMRIIAKSCGDGLSHFDLGVGEARYKAALCDEAIPLFDCIVPVGVIGQIGGALIGAAQGAKRFIKRHPRLLSAARRFRATRVDR